MTDRTSDKTEAKQFDAANNVQSAAAGRMMDEVQNYQVKNEKNTAVESQLGMRTDEPVKKFFNGEEVRKILSDCVINHDEPGIKKIDKLGGPKSFVPSASSVSQSGNIEGSAQYLDKRIVNGRH